MAAISIKRNFFLSRFKTLLPLQLQNLYHKFVEVGNKRRSRIDKDSFFEPGEFNVSKWKKMDSRSLGITRTMVPSSPYTLVKILRTRGFEAYLVGGCVRDLLLNRTPKDFDVITTADLHQIKKQFHRCQIVGRRFPICMVHIKGSVIEVSSFKTLAKHSKDKEKILVSQMPRGCDKSDLNLWKNSMHRDFTVNSLFFDPLSHKIYDYSNGMKDLLELKLRTLVPAHLSFREDCARILRGLRIAARLGLSFSKDTETAIHKHASSILDLSKSRIMMEVDYMLSFGASESSLLLLHRFHILEILLPYQAAYISRQTAGSGQCTMMLMKLFSHMDKFVACDRPSSCHLWIGLLAFHQALVDKPRDPFVVLTFASVLYHQEWQGGLRFARQCGQAPISFEPEISEPCDFISDDELSEKVHQLALQVLDSIKVLVETDSLHKTMSKFPGFPCSGMIFIPKNSARGAAELFHVLAHKVETYNKGRPSFEMNYHLLGKGDASETRFALGKIILNAMGCGVDQDDDNHPSPSRAEKGHVTPSDSRLQQPNTHNAKKQKPIAKSSSKTQNAAVGKKIEDGYLLGQERREEVISKQHVEALCASSCPKMEQLNTHNAKKQKPIAKSSSKKQNAAVGKKIEDGYLLEQEQREEVISKQHVEALCASSCPKMEERREVISKQHVEALCASSCPKMEQPNTHNAKKQKPTKKSSSKKQNAAVGKKIEDGYLLEQERREVISKQHVEALCASSCPKMEDRAMEKPEEVSVSQSPMQKLICTLETTSETLPKKKTTSENEKFPSRLDSQNPKEGLNVDAEVQADHLITKVQSVDRKRERSTLSPILCGQAWSQTAENLPRDVVGQRSVNPFLKRERKQALQLSSLFK